jgi:glycosyltransferase involved in cell wall biosynthesis
MPTRNRAALVGRAVASVQRQTMSDWELICADDGSTDDTAAVLAAIGEPRLRVVRLGRHEGISRARNAAIEEASAEYLAFLDDDNEWAAALLEALLGRAAAPGPPPDVVYCSWLCHDAASGRVAAPRRLMPGGDVFVRLLEGWNPMISAVMVRRAAVSRAGAFDEAMPSFEDYDLLLRLAAGGSRFAAVDRPLLVLHEEHVPRISGDPTRLRQGLAALDRKWRDAVVYRVGPAGYRRWRAWLHGSVEFVAVRNAVDRRDRRAAWRHVGAAARWLPWSLRFLALATALALLGPRAYHGLARVRDAVLRCTRDDAAGCA